SPRDLRPKHPQQAPRPSSAITPITGSRNRLQARSPKKPATLLSIQRSREVKGKRRIGEVLSDACQVQINDCRRNQQLPRVVVWQAAYSLRQHPVRTCPSLVRTPRASCPPVTPFFFGIPSASI